MPKKMDQRLFEAIQTNDINAFIGLVCNNERILKRTDRFFNTPLHLATKFGHIELVKEIIKLCPLLVAATNKKQETPMHEACRQGNLKVLILLFETDQSVATKLNHENQSAFLLACREGNLNVVKFMLCHSWLMEFEEHVNSIPLHVAISRGHTDIVREILKVRPSFAMQYSDDGYTPLHLAVINGYVTILKAIISSSPSSFTYLTKEGETVVHLAIRFNQYNAFICLEQLLNLTSLLHQQDQFGNTILHLAVLSKNYYLVKYIIKATAIDINCQNYKGQTAMDILEQDAEIKQFMEIYKALNLRKGSFEHQFEEQSERQNCNPFQPGSRKERIDLPISLHRHKHLSKSCGNLPALCMETTSTKDLLEHQLDKTSENEDDNLSGSESLNEARDSPSNLEQHKHLSKRHRKELRELYRSRHKKQYEIQKEALQNARNTIILVAILIATVTFTAGITPPGGVYQEGPLKGKSTVGRTTAFKVFTISNNIALFTSLCIVIVLVSIIPFQRKKLVRLLKFTHKFMWVAVSFMATAFVAATWVIVPHDRGTGWVLETILAIGAGTLGILFVYLGLMLAKHWSRKLKWKKEKGKKMKSVAAIKVKNQPESTESVVEEKIQSQSPKSVIKGEIRPQPIVFNVENESDSESTNSDVESCSSLGYHIF